MDTLQLAAIHLTGLYTSYVPPYAGQGYYSLRASLPHETDYRHPPTLYTAHPFNNLGGLVQPVDIIASRLCAG